MESILIEEKYALEYVRDMLYSLKMGTKIVDNAKYHHNSSYENASSICQYGILSLKELNEKGIRKYSEQFLDLMSDIESHVNGSEAISLSVLGLEDLNFDEDEYDPRSPIKVDFLISSEIKAGRSSYHYGNEFLSYSGISRDELRAIDIRLLKLIKLLEEDKKFISPSYSVKSVLEKYNYLKNIALSMKQFGIDIPLREMSTEENFSLDIDRLSFVPKLVLK